MRLALVAQRAEEPPFARADAERGDRVVHALVEGASQLLDSLDDALGGDVELGDLPFPDLELVVDDVPGRRSACSHDARDSPSKIS